MLSLCHITWKITVLYSSVTHDIPSLEEEQEAAGTPTRWASFPVFSRVFLASGPALPPHVPGILG